MVQCLDLSTLFCVHIKFINSDIILSQHAQLYKLLQWILVVLIIGSLNGQGSFGIVVKNICKTVR